MIICVNSQLCLYFRLRDQSILVFMLYCWFTHNFVLSSELILSSIILLILPSSLLGGFIESAFWICFEMLVNYRCNLFCFFRPNVWTIFKLSYKYRILWFLGAVLYVLVMLTVSGLLSFGKGVWS